MKAPCSVFSFRDAPIEYRTAYDWQRKIQAARIELAVPDALVLLEHRPVITIGRRCADRSDLLSSPEELAAKGIELIETDRGGEMTFHAPGQLTGYAILNLDEHGRDIHRYLRFLEESVIRTLAQFGICAGRKSGITGVWTGDSKICAIGVKVSRWVSMHGFALNICNDLDPFRRDFIPCGIRDKGVTSLAELGISAGRGDVENTLINAFGDVFDLDMTIIHDKPWFVDEDYSIRQERLKA